MSKGSARRPSLIPDSELQSNWDSIFGPKKLNIMSDSEREALELEKLHLARLLESKDTPPTLQGEPPCRPLP